MEIDFDLNILRWGLSLAKTLFILCNLLPDGNGLVFGEIIAIYGLFSKLAYMHSWTQEEVGIVSLVVPCAKYIQWK